MVVAEPAQSAPPLAGAGSLHSLVLVRTPVPQVTEQVPLSKGDQLPSTVRNHITVVKAEYCIVCRSRHVAVYTTILASL